MKYKATNGHYNSMCIFSDRIVRGPRTKRRMEQGLGFTLEEFREGSWSYAGIYFTEKQARLIHRRIGKLIKEIEKKNDKIYKAKQKQRN